MPPSPNSARISYRSPKSVPTPSSPAPALRAMVAPKAFEVTGSDQAVTGRAVMVGLSPPASEAGAATLTGSVAPQLSQRLAPEGFSRLHAGHRIAAISPAVQRCGDAPILNGSLFRLLPSGFLPWAHPRTPSDTTQQFPDHSGPLYLGGTLVLRSVFDMRKVYQNERFG